MVLQSYEKCKNYTQQLSHGLEKHCTITNTQSIEPENFLGYTKQQQKVNYGKILRLQLKSLEYLIF
jgi:hypothetical protein